MKALSLALIVIVAAVAIAHIAGADPGFVVIGYQGHLVRTTVTFVAAILVAAALLSFGLLRLLTWLWEKLKRVYLWPQGRLAARAQHDLMRGYIALAEGDLWRAEEALGATAEASDVALIHYLGAARAAHAQQASARRDRYLRRARDRVPQAEVAVGLTEAELHLDSGEIDAAQARLRELRSAHPSHPQVLRLCLRLAREQGNWREVLDLLPALKQRKALNTEEWQKQQLDAYASMLREASATDVLERLWAQTPNNLKRDPAIIDSYAAGLQSAGTGAKAVPLIQKALKSGWDRALVQRYGSINVGDPTVQIHEAEKWLAAHGDDPALLLTLGRLCLRNELWGKACYYLETCLKHESSPEAYWLLAETLDHIGDRDRAAASRRKGLELVTAERDARLAHPSP